MTIPPVAARRVAPAPAPDSGGSPSAGFAELLRRNADCRDGCVGSEEPANDANVEVASDPTAADPGGLLVLLAGFVAGDGVAPAAGATPGVGGVDTTEGSAAQSGGEIAEGFGSRIPLCGPPASSGVVVHDVPPHGAVGPHGDDRPVDAAAFASGGSATPGVGVSSGTADVPRGGPAASSGVRVQLPATRDVGTPTEPAERPVGPETFAAPAGRGGDPLGQVVGSVGPVTAGVGQPWGQGASVSTPGNRVVDQVFPQVNRLVSRGDGTHRLTLRLHPADLGEVKVVLTIRDNTVDVRFTAGAAARDALHEGAPQLRALLELSGTNARHVVIRGLAGDTGVAAFSGGAWTNGDQHRPPGGEADRSAQRGSPEDAGSRSGGGVGGQAGSQPDGHLDGRARPGSARTRGATTASRVSSPDHVTGRGAGPLTPATGPHELPSLSGLDLNL